MKPVIKILPIILIFSCNLFSQWIYQQVPSNASYYVSIAFPTVQSGVAGGIFYSSFSGRGAYTTNGGTLWQVSQVPDSCRVIIDFAFINNTTGFASGAYNTTIVEGPVNFSDYDKKTLRPLSPLFGSNGYKGMLLKTNNAGQSWVTFGSLPANVYYLNGITFVNSTTGFALASFDFSGGINDGVIKTTNSGLNWFNTPMPENINNLYDIFFRDVNTGYAAGYDVVNDTARAVILKTTNSGVSWTRQIFMQLRYFKSIDFTNANTGLVTGSNNALIETLSSYIYKTTDSGFSWFLVSSYNDIELQSVKFVTGTGIAIAAGASYNIPTANTDFTAKTTNYGMNWVSGSFNDTNCILFDSELLDNNNWYLAGGNLNVNNSPVILHTTNGSPISVEPVGTSVPVSCYLSQNYPNPFNPVTKIRFAISSGEAAQIFLSVYDVTGREVAVLVNQSLMPGNYETEFDASKLSSGVYFYRLLTENFSEIRKMILIK